MSKVSMQILFDKPDRTYAPWEEVSGAVRVQVNEECKCRTLALRRQWRTHGRGNRASGTVYGMYMILASQEDWASGTVQTYPFKFTAPQGPVTYHGHYLNVDWYVRATVHIPWAVDPKPQEEEFLLVSDKQPIQVRRETPAGAISPIRVYLALLGVILGCLWLIAAIAFSQAAPLGIVLAWFGIVVGGFFSVRYWPELKLGKVDVQVGSRGQNIRCRVRFTPRFRINLVRLTATLGVDEVCISGSGSRRETHTHSLFKKSTVKDYRQVIEAKHGFEAELPLALGPDLPVSFKASDNRIAWSITITVALSGPSNWTHKIPIVAYR